MALTIPSFYKERQVVTWQYVPSDDEVVKEQWNHFCEYCSTVNDVYINFSPGGLKHVIIVVHANRQEVEERVALWGCMWPELMNVVEVFRI